MKKTVLSTALTLFLVLPASIYAQPSPESLNIQGNGHATVSKVPQMSESNGYLWEASYEVTNYFRIPNEIKLSQGFNRLQVYSNASKNSGDNKTYNISVMKFSHWAGNYMPVETKEYKVGNFSSETFSGLSDSESYYIQIEGNVKGSMKVFEAKR